MNEIPYASNGELDYKLMFEQLMSKVDNIFALQNEYFELMQFIGERSKYISCLTGNVWKMNLFDQLAYFKTLKPTSELSEKLVKKYGFEMEDENNAAE